MNRTANGSWLSWPRNRSRYVFVFALSSVCLLSFGGSVLADTYGSASRTVEILLDSKPLDERREIFVRTPPGYDPDNRLYPVVYVLDGERNFEYVASYLDYMYDNDTYPEMIVTGVRNVNRNRDYLPRADANFADSGEAGAFLLFVRDEWVEAIGERYPVSGERILIGHSFGGVFTLHTLFSEPALFDAYIALGSSAWVGGAVLNEEARAYFENPVDADAFVFMAVGEGDGGPTVPSSKDLAAIFEESAPEGLEWVFEITPRTDHFKNFSDGMHDAFMALFPAWGFQEEVLTRARKDGADGVAAWFVEKQAELANRFYPSWFDLGVAAFILVQEGQGEAAVTLLENLKSHHPGSAHVANFTASVYEINGQNREALLEYERALEIVKREGLHPNMVHKKSLEEGVARLR